MSEMEKLKYLSAIEKDKLNATYIEYARFKRIRYLYNALTISVILVFEMYEVYVTEKSYAFTDYNTLKTVMAIVLGAFVFCILLFYVFAQYKLKNIKNRIKHLSSIHDFKYTELKNEFNMVMKTSFGGPGV